MFNLQIFNTEPHFLQQMALSLWKVTDWHKSHHAKYFSCVHINYLFTYITLKLADITCSLLQNEEKKILDST